MTAWGVAALGAGGLALVVGTVARGLGARGALTDEERYYRDHADPIISNWDRDRLPLWKQRWLAQHAPTDEP